MEYVLGTESVLTFCDVPLQARGLIDYVKHLNGVSSDKPLDAASLPSSTAALFYALDVTMLKTTDRNIHKRDMSGEELLKTRRAFLQKISQLAYMGITNRKHKSEGDTVFQSKMLFLKKDLQSIGLNPDDMYDSMLTCVKALVPAVGGKETLEMFSFPHLAYQEHMASFHGTQVTYMYHTDLQAGSAIMWHPFKQLS